MKDQSTVVQPFLNRGLKQRTDVAVLQPGEYYELLNTLTVQDGALSTRQGSRNATPQLSNPGGVLNNPQIIPTPNGNQQERLHTIEKLRLSNSDSANPRYFGYGQKIFRSYPNSAGEYLSASTSQVATDAANNLYLIGNERWGSSQFNLGSQAKPAMFFATSRGNARDDGSQNRLVMWGIPRPATPAVCSPGVAVPLPVYVPSSTPNLRISVTVDGGSVTPINAIGGNGLYRFPYTVNSPGVHPINNVALLLGSTVIVPQRVTQDGPATNTGVFEAFLAAPIPGGAQVLQAWLSGNLDSSGGYVSETVFFSASPVNLSLGGKASDGYETDDPIYFSLYVDKPGLIQDLRIRIGVGEAVTPPGDQPVDYYEHIIVPNPAQQLAQGSNDPGNTSSVTDIGLQQALLAGQGVVGEFFNVNDEYTRSLRPSQLPPATAGEPAVIDGAVPKNQWLKSGRAGSPGFNWLNVTSVTIQGRLANGDTTTAFRLRAGNLYVQGGSGPDSSVPGGVPYDYLYCFRNVVTGAVGPPSPAMIEANFAEARRTSIIVRCKGYVGDLAGRPPITFSGPGTLLLYRRGGVYTDGLYRLVKEGAINPSNTYDDVFLVDDVSDADIVANPTIDFDSDAPVTSALPEAIRATIASYTVGPGTGFRRVQFTVTSGDTSRLRVRSIIEIGNGTTLEQCVVAVIHSVSPTTMDLDIFFQYAQPTGTPAQVNAVAEQPCTLACRAFDSLFLAGDVNNPSTLYKSTSGLPESFPPVNSALRTLGRIRVSAPSDTILYIEEFNGEVVVVTRESLFIVRVWNGILQQPIRVPESRGGMDRRCTAKGDNAIYYLSYDGIYSFAGGQSVKLSQDVDWIFNSTTVNGIPPLDYNLLEFASMEYVRNALHFSYVATNGLFYRLVYESVYNRWTLNIVNNAVGGTDAITCLYREKDTSTFLSGRFNTQITNTAYEVDQEFAFGTVGASDGFVRSTDPQGISGTPINFRIATAAFTAGDPSTQKLITQAVIELSNPGTDVTIAAYYNYSNVPSADTFTIPAETGVGTVSGTTLTRASGVSFTAEMVGAKIITSLGAEANIVAFVSATQVTLSNTVTLSAQTFYIQRRRRVPLPFGNLSGTSTGTECYAMAFVINGSGRLPSTFYSMTFDVAPLAQVQRGKGYDWDDLGYPYDKRLNVLSIEYNMVGQSINMAIDTITGIEGETQTLDVFNFILGGAGTGRAKAAIPLRTNTFGQLICKMMRIRPTNAPANFQIFDYSVEYDKRPPDITLFTEPSNYGNPWEKYFTQFVCEVDTGGVDAVVRVFIDNASLPAQSFTINSTNNDRQRLITLQRGVQGRTARLVIEPGANGKFQLYNHNFVYTPADKGPVVHSFDWSDLGHPFDKRFYHVFFEYEVTQPVTFLLQGVSGIQGNQVETTIATLQATAGGRKIQQYTFPVNSIYKMVRILPEVADPETNAKIYQPSYKFEPYPADVVPYTEPSDYGGPFLKFFQQLLIDIDTGGVACDVAIEVDGTVAQTVSVTTTGLNRNQTLTLNGSIVGRMARLLLTPGAGSNAKAQLFNHSFVILPADKGPVLHTYDWTDAGHPYDKRMYRLFFEYEVQQDTNLVLEGRSGVGANQTTTIIQNLPLTTGGRKLQQYEFPINSVFKLLRIRPENGTPGTSARIYQPEFQYEKYPPDIVPYSEPTNSGTPYLKYYQQIVLDVDTGGVAATVDLEIDGTIVQNITGVSTTALNRQVQLTVNPGIQGKMARVINTPGSGGKFQLFDVEFVTLPADRGATLMTFDWDALGHPFRKRLKTVTFEAEINQPTAEMILDILDGTSGTVQTLDAMRFTIQGPGRVLQTFPIPDQTFATMIRFRPATTNVNFKSWSYTFDFVRLPQSTVLYTEYEDGGNPCEKILRSLIMDVDTGNDAAEVGIEIDGQIRHTFSINTNDQQQARIISLPSDLIGLRYRLRATPGRNGKFQLYSHQFERIIEPCRVSHWDSYEQSYGSVGYKLCAQAWIEYMSTSDLTLRFYCDDGALLWEQMMPMHDKREVFRFNLPKVSLDGKTYNKSKVYRITIDANAQNGWFKFYRDSTRLQIINLSQDQRAGWNQSYLWAQMPIPV